MGNKESGSRFKRTFQWPGRSVARDEALKRQVLERISKREGRVEFVPAAEPEQAGRQLDQGQIPRGQLVVAHQDRPAPAEPREGALHHPAAGRVRLLMLRVEFLLADAAEALVG